MKNVTSQQGVVETLFIRVCAAIWRLIRLFDPQDLQRHFSARVNASSVTMTELFKIPESDALDHVCRINNNRMKDGESFIAKRGDMVKIFNPANGKFVMRYAHGAGELRIRYNQIGLDYDAKRELGVLDTDAVDLQVVKANDADREYYLMYQDRSVSSRQSRALGWYVLLGGMLIGMVTQAFSLIAGMISLFL